MKTNVHFLSYLPHFFLKLEMFQTNNISIDKVGKSKHNKLY